MDWIEKANAAIQQFKIRQKADIAEIAASGFTVWFTGDSDKIQGVWDTQ